MDNNNSTFWFDFRNPRCFDVTGGATTKTVTLPGRFGSCSEVRVLSIAIAPTDRVTGWEHYPTTRFPLNKWVYRP